jgi:hypothetical protein
MAQENDPLLSAQVVINPSAPVKPDEIMNAFKQAGFDVGSLWANNFSISAPQTRFKSFFAADIDESELQLGALPDVIRGGIKTILFSRPPDFGPTGSF